VFPTSFNSNLFSLVDRGFDYAIAHVRGGLEKGERWRNAGRRESKVNTFRDFITVAEYLIKENYTAKGRIVARVVEVLPNGDMRVEAEKLVKINKEDERLSVSGIVRSRDVSPENAVATTAIGELKVSLNGKGVASADNAPGWLFRFFDKISPF